MTRAPTKLPPIHPGGILNEEFLLVGKILEFKFCAARVERIDEAEVA